MSFGVASLDLSDIALQAFMDDREGEKIPRNVLQGHKFDIETLGAWFEIEIFEMGPIDHVDLGDMRQTKDAQ